VSFDDDLRRFNKKSQHRASLALRKISIELFGRVIMRTPVDTGRLRGNWQATTYVPETGQRDLLDNSSKANQKGLGNSKARGEMEEFVLGEGQSTMFHLTNTLPYARVIEYGDPHGSQQAPQGMVRISVAEFQDIAKHVVRVL